MPFHGLCGRLVRKSGRTELAQPYAELVDRQRVSIAMLVRVVDIASMEYLTDNVVRPVVFASAEQKAGGQAVVPVADETLGPDQLLLVQPFGVRRVAVVEVREVQLSR